MHTWRRALVAATAMAVGLVAFGPSSWGQDRGGDPPESGVVESWALAPAGSSDPSAAGNRPNLSYEVDPGAELQDAVTLYNFSNVQLTFRIYATDAVNNEDGEFDLIPGDEEPTDVGTWITLPQDNITVGPGAQATLPITVRVPRDASPGDHVGAVLATNEAEGTGPDGKTVTLDRRTGSRVYLRVKGDLRPELAVDRVRARYTPALNPLAGSAEVTYRIENRGNVRLAGAHRVSISGPFGLAEQRVPAEDLPELLPGEGVTLHTTFDGVPATALAFAEVRLESETGEGSAVVTRRATAVAPPLTIILGGLAAWSAHRARRSYRRHRAGEVVGVQPS